MYSTSDFRKGLKVLIDEHPYIITDFQHVKPGKGNQFTRTKLRNLITGSNLERTYKSGEKFAVPDLEHKEMAFLYSDDEGFNFMDQVNYEQTLITKHDIGDEKFYLIENMVVEIMFFNGRPIGVEIPNHVALEIKHTDPGVKGDRVSSATKPATTQTELNIQVPLHINIGDTVKVDTRTNEYLERVKIG
ncbi:MAG: elongation factor P [Bdellovibrionales bacterium]